MFKGIIMVLALVAGLALTTNTAQAVPPAVKAKSEFLLADKLLNQGKFKQAAEHAEKAKSILGKSNSRIEYILAKTYFKDGEFDKAMAAVNAFFEVTPESQSASEQYNEVVALYSEIELGQKAAQEKKMEAEKKRAAAAEKKRRVDGEMVFVKGGCYQMGDTFGDGKSDEKPVHEVCVDDFYIGKWEVTYGKWMDVMGDHPNPSNSIFGTVRDRPVMMVSWNHVQRFIRELNHKTGKNYRLPTEAEWEYAARSGGKKEKFAGGNDVDAVAHYKGNGGVPQNVGKKHRPNGLGLYDMSGNAAELCSDKYLNDYYRNSPRQNPQGPSSGQEAFDGDYRVVRGGHCDSLPGEVRTASRGRRGQNTPHFRLGFRLAQSK